MVTRTSTLYVESSSVAVAATAAMDIFLPWAAVDPEALIGPVSLSEEIARGRGL
tara:strand:+ start:1837 stop:1998 length:162 start_codon:yes stop_codon:yes gene_type:complete